MVKTRNNHNKTKMFFSVVSKTCRSSLVHVEEAWQLKPAPRIKPSLDHYWLFLLRSGDGEHQANHNLGTGPLHNLLEEITVRSLPSHLGVQQNSKNNKSLAFTWRHSSARGSTRMSECTWMNSTPHNECTRVFWVLRGCSRLYRW